MKVPCVTIQKGSNPMIVFTRSHHSPGCYSEWMRTANGQIVAVSCKAREKENTALYAYAYVHAVMTLFRQYSTDDAAKTKKNELAKLILEYCQYAGQKLDVSLENNMVHPIPYIGGFLTLSNDQTMAFTVGNAVVTMASHAEKTEKRMMPSFLWAGCMKKKQLSERHLPFRTVRVYPVSSTSFDHVALMPEKTDAAKESLVMESKADRKNAFPAVYRAVITGRRHVSKGQYCQDCADYRLAKDGTVAAVLSDGAGGGNHSEYGARMNVDVFLRCCEDDIPFDRFGSELLEKIKDTHEELQRGKPVDGIQAYATLMGVYIKDGVLMWFHIGDGAIYGQKHNGTVECISDAENFQVSNRTYFTIEADAAEHLYTGRIPKETYEKILILTDGVYNGYRDNAGAHDERDIPETERNNRVMDFICRIFSQSDTEDFDDVRLAEWIDSEEILRYGDDHSAILIDFGRREN
ncbi:MAG: protein phosphatase 2C domain-containing protein [Clostridia bacterium]|nr:protein phosphatase 2C domain-containing protein [Clostridia bacterium]